VVSSRRRTHRRPGRRAQRHRAVERRNA